ncbi:MAG: tRNA uridine-5-carboxymethylaminomethyl(34) synthesis enzyme MnmG [Planctomyces sp.]|nr:tRNA uridine-5-carboxymethylaminomethyl(34) synthesis enzyme MnmG [Planctomyces sp.]
MGTEFRVIVIGGGHAGAEAAWAAAGALGPARAGSGPTVALVTLDPARIGAMSCNPAIGGLAKGQLVREIDALNGLMALAADAAGIQFKVLNASRGAAVLGPRAQCDKHAYAEAVGALIAARPEIRVIAGTAERLRVESGRIVGVDVLPPGAAGEHHAIPLRAGAVVLTTGTFMRGLMHTGQRTTPGGRFGEAAAHGVSAELRRLGFELGRLKTGTPPRLRRGSIDWDSLEPAPGDATPTPFSDLTNARPRAAPPSSPSVGAFPVLGQVECRLTRTTAAAHDLIRANLHRAPMFSGQITSAGPRYCPSIEDKVVRFADRQSHQVFLEPESLRTDWVYCNGIATSLPADVQEALVRSMPGCQHAQVLRLGYAVEYDTVRTHQTGATCAAKGIEGLYFAGQINGTSGYEEAAAQGLLAGLNAARHASGQGPVTLGRDQAFIGVLMDDLVTKVPAEPYRMFTSRAEHRLLLRADNAAERLTPLAEGWGLLRGNAWGRLRAEVCSARAARLAQLRGAVARARVDLDGQRVPLAQATRRPGRTIDDFARALAQAGCPGAADDPAALLSVHTDVYYEPYVRRELAAAQRTAQAERRPIPPTFDFAAIKGMRTEARRALEKFRPATLGQAGRLEGVTPADLALLHALIHRHRPSPNAPAATGRAQDAAQDTPAPNSPDPLTPPNTPNTSTPPNTQAETAA